MRKRWRSPRQRIRSSAEFRERVADALDVYLEAAAEGEGIDKKQARERGRAQRGRKGTSCQRTLHLPRRT
jgi:hypothetical protein